MDGSSNSPADRFFRMGRSMDYLADSALRIAQQMPTAVERRSAENVAAVLKCLGAVMNAAELGAPGALEELALDAAGIQCSRRFCDAMEAALAAVTPNYTFTDEQEGE